KRVEQQERPRRVDPGQILEVVVLEVADDLAELRLGRSAEHHNAVRQRREQRGTPLRILGEGNAGERGRRARGARRRRLGGRGAEAEREKRKREREARDGLAYAGKADTSSGHAFSSGTGV